MKIAKLQEAANNHILLSEMIGSVKRIVKAWQIWRLDCQYSTLGDYASELQANQDAIKAKRQELLFRRSDLRVSMLELGGR
ncbi:hypothetical protein [Undibacterium sp.]|uniref:hypothetical protein n=1 Tax=Undibacterium sp. TaxID=1914977 RepID=UPI0025DB8EC6|nr:hypothetical protein [Undibacterium sp.]